MKQPDYYFLILAKYFFNLVLENYHSGLAGNCQNLNLRQMLGLENTSPNSDKQLKTRCYYEALDKVKQRSGRLLSDLQLIS